ncbi:MAG: general secretion pathway protein GspK [bacterium]|nr:general secretion pathway protein GspK [bacterium]
MQPQSGVVLIITLWILLILSTIALGFAFEIHLESRVARYQLDRYTASYVAQAGLHRAFVELKNDLILDRKARPQSIDSLGESWANNEFSEEYYQNVKLGDGKYSVTVVDEYSKLNINYISREMFIAALTVVHPELEDEEERLNFIADAWQDYRDSDTQYWKDTTIDELAYYNPESTDMISPKYLMKNGLFETVDELLNLPGFTPELLYKKVPIDIENGQERSLYELFTVHGSGLININTAPKPVLVSWFRGSVPDMEAATELAQQVIDRREGLDEIPGTDDDKPFHSLAELGTLPGLNPGYISVLLSRGQVATNLFRITATGEIHRAKKTITVLVSRDWVVRQLTEQEKEYNEDKTKTTKEGVSLRIKQWIEQ